MDMFMEALDIWYLAKKLEMDW